MDDTYDKADTDNLHGQTRYNMQSRFLSELPERSLKWLSEMPSASAQGSLGLGAERGNRGYYGGGGYGGGGYGSGAGNSGGNWRPRLDSAVHERNRQSGWVRPADPGIPASGDASGKARAGRVPGARHGLPSVAGPSAAIASWRSAASALRDVTARWPLSS